MTYRVIVTASRNWKARLPIRHALTLRLHLHDALVVMEGGCPTGGDAIAREWVADHQHHGAVSESYPAAWDDCGPGCPDDDGQHRRPRRPGDLWHPGMLPTYCPKAGPRRNADMVAAGADECLGFPRSGAPSFGTRNCMKLARQAGIRVRSYPQEMP